MQEAAMFGIDEILKYVPHRYPFLFIDQILAFEENQAVTTLKNISADEAVLQGHFPGCPVFPGVLIIENMAQSACFLLVRSYGGLSEGKVYYLGRVNKMSFIKPVLHGDQLITRIAVQKTVGNSAMVSAVSGVDDEVVAKGELLFAMGE
jgi:3-hydroxyacyl-[acyl-carrier-protein] dehydratase